VSDHPGPIIIRVGAASDRATGRPVMHAGAVRRLVAGDAIDVCARAGARMYGVQGRVTHLLGSIGTLFACVRAMGHRALPAV